MKFKEIAIPTLAAASLISNIGDVAASFEGIIQVRDHQEIVLNQEDEIIALPSCIPQETDEDDNQMQSNIYQCGYIHYNYNIITCFILAHDEKHASSMAQRFRQLLDNSNQFKENGNWKMHLHEESKSPGEILEVATKAELVYTLTAGEKIGA
jgi:hypothetical protein